MYSGLNNELETLKNYYVMKIYHPINKCCHTEVEYLHHRLS